MQNRFSPAIQQEIEKLQRRLVLLQSCMTIVTIRAGGSLTFTAKDFDNYENLSVTVEEDKIAREIRFNVKSSA